MLNVFIYNMCVCIMLRGLKCQGVHYFMCLYMCVYYVKSFNMSRIYYFMCVYICVNYVKSVKMSRSPLFPVFICVCV